MDHLLKKVYCLRYFLRGASSYELWRYLKFAGQCRHVVSAGTGVMVLVLGLLSLVSRITGSERGAELS